jgi:sugar phosphate isomerase/epimerase
MPNHSSYPMFNAHESNLGIQLYTLDPDLEQDFAGTLSAVRGIGYRSVELPSFYGRSPQDLRSALDRADLVCRSMHVRPTAMLPGPNLSGDLAALAEAAHHIGVTDLVMPIFLLPHDFTPPAHAGELEIFRAAGAALATDDYHRMADFLNEKGELLRQHGLRISYHNHNCEFAQHGGKTGLQILLDNTDPDLVYFELDVGWTVAAGIDPIVLLEAYKCRFTQIHVKDIKASTIANFNLRQDPTFVGNGIIDWQTIIPIAKAHGVTSFYVEQEPPFAEDRLLEVAKSYRYLTNSLPEPYGGLFDSWPYVTPF